MPIDVFYSTDVQQDAYLRKFLPALGLAALLLEAAAFDCFGIYGPLRFCYVTGLWSRFGVLRLTLVR